MTDLKLLDAVIRDSGITITALAKKVGIKRATLYNKMNGKSEFTGTEIVKLTDVLHLSDDLRDQIFLGKNVN